MERKTGNVLKSSEVELQGSFHLDIGPVPASPQQTNGAPATPQVHIVENHPDFAVLEITCSCGTKSHIRCEYTNVQSADNNSKQAKTNKEDNNEN